MRRAVGLRDSAVSSAREVEDVAKSVGTGAELRLDASSIAHPIVGTATVTLRCLVPVETITVAPGRRRKSGLRRTVVETVLVVAAATEVEVLWA